MNRDGLLERSETGAARPDTIEILTEYVVKVAANRSSEWAWQGYKDTIGDLIKILGARAVMEIGGGRWPLFSQEEIVAAGTEYFVNDISDKELSLAPAHVQKFCCDIGQDGFDGLDKLPTRMDLMFSKMVFEHVDDTLKAYKNIFNMLVPGGVCINFHPVLYSPPFVINRLLPETASTKLLRLFFPYRTPDDTPKHPAKYDRCRISDGQQQALLSIGYRRVWQVPFWGHDYFKKIPIVRQLDAGLSTVADRNSWVMLASYCFTIVIR